MKLVALFVAVGLLIAGAWWWRRGDDRHPPAPARPAASIDAPARVDPPIVPPRRLDPVAPVPTPAPVDVAPPPAPDSVPFDHEVREPAWAVDQERELKLRLDRLGADLAAKGATVTITGAECRRSLCKVEVDAAATADLSAWYGAIETPEGLYGWADTVVLGEVATDAATGRLTTSVLVQFER